MANLVITIEENSFSASSPKVKHLKEFLKFQNEYNSERGFDNKAFNSLSNILKSVFKGLTDKHLENMEVHKFMEVFNEMARWMAESMGGKEKN